MSAEPDFLSRQLEEIQLIQYSLLPNELFSLILPEDDEKEWTILLQDHNAGNTLNIKHPSSPYRFKVEVSSLPLNFELELPKTYPDALPIVLVRGDTIERSLQEEWQKIVLDKLDELRHDETECALACPWQIAA